MNHLKTFILLAAMTALFAGVGYMIGRGPGMAIALLFAGGMNLYELAGRLGHESITTTADTYGHLVPDVQWRAAELAESAIPLGAPPAIE